MGTETFGNGRMQLYPGSQTSISTSSNETTLDHEYDYHQDYGFMNTGLNLNLLVSGLNLDKSNQIPDEG